MSELSVALRRGGGPPSGVVTGILLLVALACLPVAFVADDLLWRSAGVVAAATITVTALLLSLGRMRRQRADQKAIRDAARAFRSDPAPVFCTDDQGAILFQNHAAQDRFGPRAGQPVSRALSGLVPNAAAVAFRQESALTQGRSSSETVATRRGVVRVTSFGWAAARSGGSRITPTRRRARRRPPACR